MLTKGAIGNLVNRYRAVLKKCNLINTFGSLAVASMLVLGGAAVASAEILSNSSPTTFLIGGEYQDGGKIQLVDMTAGNYAYDTETFMANVTGDTSNNIAFSSTSPTTTIIWASLASDTSSDHKSPTLNFVGDKNTKLTATSNYYVLLSRFAPVNIGTATKPLGEVTLTTTASNASVIYVTGGNNSAHADKQYLGIFADKININAASTESRAIFGNEGSMVISANNELTINGSIASTTTEYGNASALHIAINQEECNTAKTIINGDIIAEKNAQIAIGMHGDGSTLNGDVVTAENASLEVAMSGENSSVIGTITDNSNGVTLGLANNATWKVTGDSKVKTVKLNKGNVNVKADVNIEAESVSGSGNINMEDTSGSFTALTADESTKLTVQAIKEDGTVKNADEVTPEELEALKAKVKADKATIEAYAPEADIIGDTTVDQNGNVTVARNSLMDAALQASVSSISLDKILTNDVRKRLGDIRADQNTTGVWMRWDGGKLKGDAGVTNDFNTIQIGGDTKVAKNCRLGVAGSFTHGDTEFARGTGELEGFSFAAYATWMGENGMFADVVARLGHFSTEMQVEGRTGDIDSRVASLSGEYGWRFNLCDQFFIEPQIELAYTYVSSDDMTLGDAKYSFDSVDSLTGRAGLVAGWNLPNDRGNLYARASVVQQFMGDAKISGMKGDIHSIQELDGNDTWLEYGIGANVKLTDKTYLWADVERTEGAKIEEEWRGTVGVRFSF